jgi:hypothetical protein
MGDHEGYEFIYVVQLWSKVPQRPPTGGLGELQPIDIGLFAVDPDARTFSDKDVIALEKRPIKSGDPSIEFVVNRKPAFVGVDPYLKLISRNTSNDVKSLGSQSRIVG